MNLGNINPDIEAYNNATLEVGAGEAFGAALDLARADTAFFTANRIMDQNTLEKQTANEPKLDPEELNKRFKMPKPFTEPMNLSMARMIYGQNQARQELQDRVNAGPQDGWHGIVNTWGAGLLAHAMDPIETSAGLLVSAALPVVAGETIAAKLGLNAGKHALTQTAEGLVLTTGAKATALQTAARVTVEGTLQNMVNVPLDVYNSEQEQREFNAKEAVIGALGAAAGFGVIHGAVKLGGAKLTDFLGRVSPKHTEVLQKVAASQVLEGKKFEVGPVVKDFISDTNYPKTDFVKLSLDDLKNTTMYAPKEIVTKDINAKSAVISDYYGDGIYLTDDPIIANGSVSRKLNDYHGSILSGKVKDANFIDLDLPLSESPKAKEVFQGIIDSFPGDKTKIDINQLKAKDVFDAIHDGIESGDLPADTINKINTGLKEQGYDGLRLTADKMAGADHAPHNAVVLFDANKFEHEGNHLPDVENKQKPSQTEVQQLFEKNNSPENKIIYDEKAYKENNKIMDEPPKPDTPSEYEKNLKETTEQVDNTIKLLGEKNEHSKELIQERENIKLENQTAAKEDSIIKAAFDCLRGA